MPIEAEFDIKQGGEGEGDYADGGVSQAGWFTVNMLGSKTSSSDSLRSSGPRYRLSISRNQARVLGAIERMASLKASSR
jgi:hypothetical protein